ncbi:capsid assembly scaffolding protein Gp46 family protein [Enterococcus canintestini]|uniref:Phage scaffold protein n=2 Tax=Enterococcus canintestini TaxID=317010 RepID=A0A1L8R561_9ENTE|nr:DUF4355 domain-containing protein [Enterococcus canintestini]OJG14852.1 hypothetical protein RU96_GL000606 [Enterococcus canintestini]
MMSDFKPIETQEDFDAAISERIRREKETLEKKYSDYEQLKSRNGELETENTVLKTAADEVEKERSASDKEINDLKEKVANYEMANLKTKIALKHGLPFDFADRLVGEDEESLIADAERFSGFIKNTSPIPPLKESESPLNDSKDGAYKNLLENIELEGE